MPEDRPTNQQLDNDEEFDNWLEAYDRKMQQKSTPKQKIANSPGTTIYGSQTTNKV